MKPIQTEKTNYIYAAHQDEYLSLPVYKDKDGKATSCWKLSLWDRVKVLLFGKIYLQILTFNKPLQPVGLGAHNPLKIQRATEEIKVYRMDEYCTYAGRSKEEVINKYIEDSGLTREELIDEGAYPWVLPDEGMETLSIQIEGENGDTVEIRTFKEHLAIMIEDGEEFPCLFGSKES